MSSDLEGARQRLGQWRALRHIDQLVSAGNLSQAERLLDEAFPDDASQSGEGPPPMANFLRARLRLLRGEARAVIDLMNAAEHAPALLLRITDEIERWLSGPGKGHDTPTLRRELARLRVLHHHAHHERHAAPEKERLRPATPETAEDILLALAPWRHEIRFAWAAECACEHAPRWRHVELLLHMRPRMWHFLPGARERMERLHAAISEELKYPCGSLRLHVHPLMALPAHMREIRKSARAIITPPAASPRRPQENARKTVAEDGRTASPWSRVSPWPPRLKRAAAYTMRSSLAATLLVLPIYLGWKAVQNEITRGQVSALEQRHAAVLARKVWRREAAAHPHQPLATTRVFLLMLKAGDSYPGAPVLDAESRQQWKRARPTPGQLRQLWRRWATCGTPSGHVAHDRAVLHWSPDRPTCAPLLLRREQGRWRVAWEETRRLLATDARGRWRLANGLPHGWLFGFRDMLFAADGSPRPLRGAQGKNDLIRIVGPTPGAASSAGDAMRAHAVTSTPPAPHAEKRPGAPPPALARLRLQGHGTDEMAQMR